MNGAEAVIEALKKEGVKFVFGLPGTTVMPLLDALYEHPDIRFITVRHEQVAAFMADGYARGSGRVGVCMASRGPGAANLTIGVHNAFAESVPVLALLGQVSDAIYYRDAFEECDLTAFFRPLTKWAAEIHRPERIPELVQRAVRTANSGRRRPVMLSVPLDIQLATANFQFQIPMTEPVSQPRTEDLQKAAQVIIAARRPLIFAGGGALGTTEELITLAHSQYLPVLTTWRRKDAYPNGDDLFIGTVGPGAPAVGKKALAEADVVLAVGCRFSEFSTYRWTVPLSGVKIIHIDVDYAEMGKVYVPEVPLIGEARLAMLGLNEALAQLQPGDNTTRQQWVAELRKLYAEETALPVPEKEKPVSSAGVVNALEEVLRGEKALIVEDAATFGAWLQKYYSFAPGTYFAAGGGSMGWGFPAAMGLKLARPKAIVVNITGDGAFWMVAQDLETAVREKIPVVNVVTNNFCFGNTRDRQKTAHGGRYIGVWYQNPDFAAYARLLGAHGERVEEANQLAPALKRAIASGKPAVVDVIMDQWEGLPPGAVPATAK